MTKGVVLKFKGLFMNLFFFTIAWIAIVYLFNAAISRKFHKIEPKLAGLYISTVALIGVFGEIFADSLYASVAGQPLWVYHVFPVHDGYTSMYSVVVWSMYGFYLYLMHDYFTRFHFSTHTLAIIISIEAIILELLINSSYLYFFDDYFFYYLPGELWHLTTIQAIPFYFLAGIVILKTLKRFKADPKFFIAMNIVLTTTLVFLAS